MTDGIIQKSFTKLRESLTLAYKLDNNIFLYSNLDYYEKQLIAEIKRFDNENGLDSQAEAFYEYLIGKNQRAWGHNQE